MTLKGLLVRWFWIVVCLSCLITAHVLLSDKADDIAERFATPYTSLTQEDAVKRAISSCNESQYRFLLNCKEPSALWISLEHSQHRQEFAKIEIYPIAEKLRTGLALMFGVIYAVIALYALMVLKKWFTIEGRQAMGRSVVKLGDAMPSSQGLKDVIANRKLRQAQNDFLTVKNLYENGLITEQMFLKRKDELKAALDGNGVFNKDDAASSN